MIKGDDGNFQADPAPTVAKNITFGPHDGNFVKSTADNMKSFPDTKEKPTRKIKKVNRFSCMIAQFVGFDKSKQEQVVNFSLKSIVNSLSYFLSI